MTWSPPSTRLKHRFRRLTSARTDNNASEGEKGSPMKKLLYVTQSCGFRHEVLPYSQEMVQKIGAESGAFAATCTDDTATVDWNNLGQYDAIAFCTTGELPL